MAQRNTVLREGVGGLTFFYSTLQDDLKFLRIRSKKHEIMIAPDKDYTLLVIQKPAVS